MQRLYNAFGCWLRPRLCSFSWPTSAGAAVHLCARGDSRLVIRSEPRRRWWTTGESPRASLAPDRGRVVGQHFTWMAVYPVRQSAPDQQHRHPDRYQERVGEQGGRRGDGNGLVLPDSDVYVGAMRFNWTGSTVLERAATTSTSAPLRTGSRISAQENLNKQINLQVFGVRVGDR